MKQVSFSSTIQQHDCSWWRFDDDGEKASDDVSSDPTSWLSRQDYKRLAKREKALIDGLKSGDIHFHDEFLITNGLETPNDRIRRHLQIREVLLAVLSEQQEQQSREQQENCYLSTDIAHDEILARVSLATTQKSTFVARERGIVLENYVLHSNSSNRKDQSPCYSGFRSSCCEDRNSNKKDVVTWQQHRSSYYKAENDQHHQHQSGSIISKDPSTTATTLEEEIMPTPGSPIREGRWQTSGGSTLRPVTFTAKAAAATASMVPKDVSPALLISQRKPRRS